MYLHMQIQGLILWCISAGSSFSRLGGHSAEEREQRASRAKCQSSTLVKAWDQRSTKLKPETMTYPIFRSNSCLQTCVDFPMGFSRTSTIKHMTPLTVIYMFSLQLKTCKQPGVWLKPFFQTMNMSLVATSFHGVQESWASWVRPRTPYTEPSGSILDLRRVAMGCQKWTETSRNQSRNAEIVERNVSKIYRFTGHFL